jgi:DNA polymerase-2
VALDGIELLRAGFWSFESFALDVVAKQLLGRGKAIQSAAHRVQEIQRMYREDPVALAAYNLEDCRLVLEIFAKTNLLAFARERASATGLSMDRYGGSVAAFDHLYPPRLHRAGRVAPDVGDVEPGPGSPGGYVMDSQPGLYRDVLLLDFLLSLSPAGIRCPAFKGLPSRVTKRSYLPWLPISGWSATGRRRTRTRRSRKPSRS